jgi:DNA polymerase I
LLITDILQPDIDFLKRQKVFIVDVETEGVDPYNGGYILCTGVGVSSGKTYCFEGLPEVVSEILSDSEVLIGHNIKFDLKFLSQSGVKIKNQRLLDTIVMARLCSSERFPGLDLISCLKRFVDPFINDNKLVLKEFMKKNKIKQYKDIPFETLGKYCEEDILNTRNLYIKLASKVKGSNQKEVFELEIETTKSLFFIEDRGMRIDGEYCKNAIVELKEKLLEVEKRVEDLVGYKFNLLSPKQLGEVFHKLGIKSPGTTIKGSESWGEQALLLIDHPLSGLIKEYRTIAKLHGTYFEPFAKLKEIHASFNNWTTATGRLSCSSPNLQNIPRFQKNIHENDVIDEDKKKKIIAMSGIRKKTTGQTAGGSGLSSWGFTGDEKYEDNEDIISVRRLFIPRDNYYLYSFDFSQMEIRVFISYLNNPKIFKEMASENFDFHSFVCKLVFGYSEDHKDFAFYRQISKAITFGLIYGMGLEALAGQMGKELEEAKIFRKKYFDRLSGSKEFINLVKKKVAGRGYIYNRYGRRYIIDPEKSYVGVNYLVQGTTGDLVKDRMNEVRKYLDKNNMHSKILNQIHDEILAEIHTSEEEIVVPKIKWLLESNKFGIPLKVDVVKCYPSWAHKK